MFSFATGRVEERGMGLFRALLRWSLSLVFNLVLGIGMLCFHIWLVAAKLFGYRPYIWSYHMVAGCILAALRLAGCGVRIRRDFPLPLNRPLLVVSNHQSVYDIPLICWALREYDIKFIAKRELGRFIPAVSHAIRNSGCLLIERDNPRQAIPAMRSFGRLADQNNYAVSIFPEGTRARDGQMKKFKPAGLQVLLRSMPRALIVPAVVRNSWLLVRYRQFPMPVGTTVELQFLEPIERGEMEEAELIAKVEAAVREGLGSPAA